MFRPRCLVALFASFLVVGCGSKGTSSGSSSSSGTNSAAGDTPDDQPSIFRNLRTHLDLHSLVHLADVDHHGLYIDFGTPSRMKYTVGQWRTGWGKDQTVGTTTFTNSNAGDSRTARIYFHVERPTPLTLRFRMKPIGTRNVSVYLNNTAISVVRLDEGSGFKDYDVVVPVERAIAGENHVLLSFGGVTRVGDENVAVAMDSVRVIPGAADAAESFSPPAYGAMASEMKVGDVQRRAIAVRAPTTLAWYVDVPRNAKLGFGFGAEGESGARATAKIVVTPEGSDPVELFARSVGARWQDELVSLERFAGKVVRIELKVDGQPGAGRVGWSTPAILVPPSEVAAAPRQAKNVVVLLIDTMRADRLRPFNPETRVRTPHLDRFAQEGATFVSAQSPENWTKPSVASVLTSLHPQTHRAKTDAARLPQSATLLSEVYKEAGFATGSFIANGYVSDRFGFAQGWDHYRNYIRENKPTTAEAVFREAGDWIEAHKGERFFAYVHTIDPHVPYDPPEDLLRLYDARDYTGQVSPRLTADLLEKAKRNPPVVTFDESDERRLNALYDGEVTYHDRYFGEFVDRLKRLGVYDDTIFLITADHGEEFDDHGSWGHGHSVYQELLHVPLLFRLPNVVPAGARVTETVSTMDVMPTVLEATGVRVPEAAEGRSLLRWARGEVPAGPAVAFSDFLDDRRVIRAGRWKLILRGLSPTLFDLEADPGEKHELALGARPIAARYCRVMLGQFLGAADRRNWLRADQNAPAAQLEQENAEVDDTLREQLRALGYAQ